MRRTGIELRPSLDGVPATSRRSTEQGCSPIAAIRCRIWTPAISWKRLPADLGELPSRDQLAEFEHAVQMPTGQLPGGDMMKWSTAAAMDALQSSARFPGAVLLRGDRATRSTSSAVVRLIAKIPGGGALS